MKITLFISSLYGGGAERVTCNLANFLIHHGHDVEILTVSETEESYELDSRVNICTLLSKRDRKNKIWNKFIRLPRLWHYLLHKKNDAYVVMLPTTTITLLMFRQLTRAKIIASERVDPSVYPARLARRLLKYAQKADGLVFQTADAKAWYEERILCPQSIIIPNAINPEFIGSSFTGVRRKVIASAGRLTDQKNFELLINSFSRIANDYPDYSLEIYGEGECRLSLEAQIEKLGLTTRVFLPGNVEKIAGTMRENSIFVLSSNYEGMPNSLLEAMALGLSCISTDCPCGGPRFLIENMVNGLLIPVGNIDAMENALRFLLSHEIIATNIGKNAEKIKDRLNPEKVYGQWEEFIIKVSGR